MNVGCNSKSKRNERKSEQVWVHQTRKPHHGEPSIKWEMNYEMENKLAIVLSNKGSYPQYIKRPTIQKWWSMQGISLRNGGNFRFVWGLKNNSEMKRKKNTFETRKDIHILNQGSKKYERQIRKKDTGEGPQTSLLKWQPLIHGMTICPLPEGSLT